MTSIDTTHDDVLREVPFAKEDIYNGRILHVEKWKVTCPNGREAAREIVVHMGAAAVVPVFENGDTLLVRQHRVAVDRVTLEIPAGGLNGADEPPMLAAARELEEETGYHSENLTHLLSLRTTVAFCNEKIEIYVAQDLKPTHQHLDEDEFIDVYAYSVDELCEMIYSGKIEDGKTIAAIMSYKAKYEK